jgi:Zn-finger nucleic acid-binding protein
VKCGALLPAAALVADGSGCCPDCHLDLAAHAFGAVGYAECPRCSGLFLKREAFEAVTKDADTRAKVRLAEPPADAAPASAAPPGKRASGAFPAVRYRPCPACRKLMNRSNYGGGSGIVLDACRDHGLWFDKGELAAIVDFLEKGGWDRIRAREREKLSEEVRSLENRRAFSRRRDAGLGLGPQPAGASGPSADRGPRRFAGRVVPETLKKGRPFRAARIFLGRFLRALAPGRIKWR